MELVLIRHTAVDTPKGLIYGQTDVGLKPSFPQEANTVKTKVGNIEFDAIYCSPLSRCKLLAEFLFPKEPLVYDDRLMEMNFGDWEGEYWDVVEKSEQAKVWFDNWQTECCPNGESNTLMQLRILSFLEEVKMKHAKQRVAVVCHGGPIRAFLTDTEQNSMDEQFKRQVEYGEVIRIENNKVKFIK